MTSPFTNSVEQTLYNILNFEQVFPDAVSHQTGAELPFHPEYFKCSQWGHCHNNVGRKEKRLWTENEEGEKIAFPSVYETGFDEADYVAGKISGAKCGKACIIMETVPYPLPYQCPVPTVSRKDFITANIPYKIVGGVNFYSRREIKDLLAYLKTIDNAMDDLAVRRIINVPKRGIGATTSEQGAGLCR